MAAFHGPLSSLPHPLHRRFHLSYSQQPHQQQQQQQIPLSSHPSDPPPPLPPSQLLSTSAATTPVDPSLPNQQRLKQKPKKPPASSAESTDWIASSLSRRFGLGAGLAWAAFLAVGVVSEQIKTRLETSQQEATTRDLEKEEEVLLPNGIRYYEMRVGGGAAPRAGDLVVIDLKGRVESSGGLFIDTFGEAKKPLALVMGSRPYTKGMCEGVEYVLRKMMKAGGKARVIVPPSLGFGDQGADLGEGGVQIPPSSTLEFIVQVDKVSIAPA